MNDFHTSEHDELQGRTTFTAHGKRHKEWCVWFASMHIAQWSNYDKFLTFISKQSDAAIKVIELCRKDAKKYLNDKPILNSLTVLRYVST
jgi:hypothetical protein